MKKLSILSLLCLIFISAIDPHLPDAQSLGECVPDVEPKSSYSYNNFFPFGETREIKADAYAVAHLTKKGEFTLFGINNVAGTELRKFTFTLPAIFAINGVDFSEDQNSGHDYIALSPNHCVVLAWGRVKGGPPRAYATVFARELGHYGYEEQEWYLAKFFKVDLELNDFDVEIIEKNNLTHFMVSGIDWVSSVSGKPAFYPVTRFSIYKITHRSPWDIEHGSLPQVDLLERGGWPCRYFRDAVAFHGLGDLPAFAFLSQNNDQAGRFNGSCNQSNSTANSIHIIAPTPADLEDYNTIADYKMVEQEVPMLTIKSSGPKIFTTSALDEPRQSYSMISTILTFKPVAGFNEIKSYRPLNYCDIDWQHENPVSLELMGAGQVIIERFRGMDPKNHQTVRMVFNNNPDQFTADYNSYANLILGDETGQVAVGASYGWITNYNPTTGKIELSTLAELIKAVNNARTTGLTTSDQKPIERATNKIEETEIEIFPNPSSTEALKIRGAAGYSSATLINASAVSLKATPIVDGTATINVSDLPSGIYMIQFTGPGKMEVKKWIKK